MICDDAREDAARNAGGVEDRNEIRCQAWAHGGAGAGRAASEASAGASGLHDKEGKGHEGAHGEDEHGGDEGAEDGLCIQRPGESGRAEWLAGMRQTGADSQVGEDEKGSEEHGHDAHGVGEAEGGHEASGHDWEDDAAERGAGGDDAEGRGAAVAEMGTYSAGASVEDGGSAEGGEDALAEDDLVVGSGARNEHKAEHVGEGAREEEDPRAVAVEEVAEKDTAQKHHTGLGGRDPGDRGGGVGT